MTLFQIIQVLKEIALTQPNVKTATDGSIYDVMNTNPSVKYDVVHFSQTTHQSDEETDFYGLNIFYVSRLEDSLEDNRLQIQSIGKEVLDNIIRTFCENWGIDFPVITYTPFTQKFNDLCAGCYCNLRLEIPKEIICADDYVAEVVPGSGIKLQDIGITITQNGLIVVTPDAEYDGIGEIRIVTNVPQSAAVLQDKEVEYIENGSYSIHPDPAYDGLSSVSVDVLVPDNYDEGYEDGKEDGAEEQKAKMTSLSVTANGNYNRTDGYSAVTVDVPQTGQSINNQTKNIQLKTSDFRLSRKGDGPYFYSFSPNTLYHITYDSGYTGLEEAILNCGLDPYEAIALGENQQKAKMVATAITENGEYGRPDGYSAVTVNVPDRYDEGFTDGEAYQKSLLAEVVFTENGTYARDNGYSAVTVNVPQTGASNEDLKANLENRYFLIPDGTSHLRDGAFYRTCFETITIPSSVSAIGMYGFAQNQCLTSITIPDTVLSIGTYCFSGDTNLESVYLGTGLTEIPSYALAACPSLTGVTFPATITDIGTSIFNSGNTGLEEITFEGLVPPTLASTGNSLGPTGFTFPIYVPCQSIDAYKAAFGTRYATRIQCRQEPVPTAITAFTLVVDTAITDSGTATTTYSPTGLATDIVFTSSNPAVATIDPATGVITVIADGTVTICAEDRISGLQDCKTITVYKSPSPAPSLSEPLTFHITKDGSVRWKTNDASFATTIQYKKNDGDWTNITATTGGTIIPVVSGDTLWFRGNNSRYALGANIGSNIGTESLHNSFSGSSAGFEVSNNVMSLINSNSFATLKTFSSNYALAGLFAGCSGLTNAENLLLPATSLTQYCYSSMFKWCRYLVSAPSLPATSLSYGCYEEMFKYCVRLKTAPSILPALTLQPYCYSWMFMNCTELTAAPELPARTLASYSYLHMFDFCPKLKTIKCLATNISAEYCTVGWVEGVSATGTFAKASTMSSWTRGKDGIPTGWTVTNVS